MLLDLQQTKEDRSSKSFRRSRTATSLSWSPTALYKRQDTSCHKKKRDEKKRRYAQEKEPEIASHVQLLCADPSNHHPSITYRLKEEHHGGEAELS
jgi:hypothetical protein